MTMDEEAAMHFRSSAPRAVQFSPALGLAVTKGETEMMGSEASAMRRVLLVEDDDILRGNYQALLSAHRLSVRACATKAEAFSAFNADEFDIVILDVTLGHEY